MVHIQQHAEEIFWLRRRIYFLETLDRLLDQDRTAYEAEQVGNHFAKIEDPSDLVERLKEIYGEELP
jgi:hypothetical protein